MPKKYDSTKNKPGKAKKVPYAKGGKTRTRYMKRGGKVGYKSGGKCRGGGAATKGMRYTRDG